METEWIEWKGGECPVADDIEVEIVLRGGSKADDRADAFDWTHWWLSPESDIISYRIVKG